MGYDLQDTYGIWNLLLSDHGVINIIEWGDTVWGTVLSAWPNEAHLHDYLRNTERRACVFGSPQS